MTASRSIARSRSVCTRRIRAGFSKKKISSDPSGRNLVVLSADYFDSNRVSDENIRSLRSVLTVVDVKVVHDTMR